MKIEVVQITPNALDIIESMGRTCYASPSNKETQEKFIKLRIQEGHESLLEHAIASFRVVEVSRALTHQLVRHRVAVYSQESQRYVKADNFKFVIPDSIANDFVIDSEYRMLMARIRDFYSRAVSRGIPAEDARYLLPNATHTKIGFTMNFRELRHFFKLRTEKHAQWEIRAMAKEMLDIMTKKYPCCFEDLK